MPHLTTAIGVSESGIDLAIDFIPRADGGYNPKYEASGEYPPPDCREAFACAGVRQEFSERFFTNELKAWRSTLLGEAVGRPGKAQPWSGPLHLEVSYGR